MDMHECSCKGREPIAMSAMNNCADMSKNQVISVPKLTEATILKPVTTNSLRLDFVSLTSVLMRSLPASLSARYVESWLAVKVGC